MGLTGRRIMCDIDLVKIQKKMDKIGNSGVASGRLLKFITSQLYYEHSSS